jgi:hypothetical protein
VIPSGSPGEKKKKKKKKAKKMKLHSIFQNALQTNKQTNGGRKMMRG